MVYSAGSIALAVLETVVHMQVRGLPLNRYLVGITIPDDIWKTKEVWTKDTVKVGWDALPTGKVSLDLGDAWLKHCQSAIALVPSVIVPEEFNVLINPKHPDAGRLHATKVRKWLYDGRMMVDAPSHSAA
jgi:RES domain-containing protein